MTIAAAACADSGAGHVARSAAPAVSPWYARTRVLDLNGDGRADSAVLVARGARPDSLDVSLALFVDGRVVHLEEWRSDYELVDDHAPDRARPAPEAFLRERLDRALGSLAVAPLDTTEVREMSSDPGVLDSVTPRPRTQLTLAYGYETTVVFGWDASRRRFVVLWACC